MADMAVAFGLRRSEGLVMKNGSEQAFSGAWHTLVPNIRATHGWRYVSTLVRHPFSQAT